MKRLHAVCANHYITAAIFIIVLSNISHSSMTEISLLCQAAGCYFSISILLNVFENNCRLAPEKLNFL